MTRLRHHVESLQFVENIFACQRGGISRERSGIAAHINDRRAHFGKLLDDAGAKAFAGGIDENYVGKFPVLGPILFEIDDLILGTPGIVG